MVAGDRPVERTLTATCLCPDRASMETTMHEVGPKIEVPAATSPRRAVWSAVVLTVTTIIVALVWLMAIDALSVYSITPTSQPFTMPPGASLKVASSIFHYDPQKNALVSVGPIDGTRKRDLAALLVVVDQAQEESTRASYLAALDDLAIASRKDNRGAILMLLVVGGLSGVLGVQLRSLTNFIGRACYKNDLDLVRWWPYYSLRPFTGLLLGMIIVIVVQAGFYQTNVGFTTETIWWVAISLLAGFGADEFTQRLRLISQTLFGESKREPAESTSLPAAKPGAGANPGSGNGTAS
jgi:hypothetical protein